MASTTTDYFVPSAVLTPAATHIGMTAALAKAASEGWEVTVCICDAGGVPMHVQRTARAFPASYDVACGKAKSAALFAKETGLLEDSVNGGRSALLSSSFVLMRGGCPILYENGQVCGAVGVSGVQADQDELVARAAVEAVTNLMTNSYMSPKQDSKYSASKL
jgi:glc operon protein GlcG